MTNFTISGIKICHLAITNWVLKFQNQGHRFLIICRKGGVLYSQRVITIQDCQTTSFHVVVNSEVL